MIRNGAALIASRPISEMATSKRQLHGLTFGLGEAGYDVRIRQDVTLHPLSRFRLASTVEHFDVPTDLVGVVHDKSSWARRGLSVFNTVIEPGWNGYLTLELVYHGWRPLRIRAFTGIAQILWHELTEPAQYRGRYQGQPDRPVSAIEATA